MPISLHLWAPTQRWEFCGGFRTLNMQNLLYLQAELVKLESELSVLAKADIEEGNSGDRIKSWYTQDWIPLSNYDSNTDDKQWQKMLQIRTKIKEYSKKKTLLGVPLFQAYG